MTVLFKSDQLTISRKREEDYYRLILNYKQFNRQLNEIHKTNVFFSTYLMNKSVEGFLKLDYSLYVRLLIKHRFGSIANIDKEIRNKKLVKMKVAPNNGKLGIFIFPNTFQKMASGYYENKFLIPFPLLNDYYIDLTLTSNLELIRDRRNTEVSNNRKLIKKDLLESDSNRLRLSQNADGSRKSNELFSGSGSNISRRFKYIK